MKKITVLIPCLNEEKGIGNVLDSIPRKLLKKRGFSLEIVVIDNGSKDKTAQIAKRKKANVILEANKGKGFAIRAGFNAVSKDTDFVVMLDGDNSYKAEEMLRLIEPLENNFSDCIIGTRLGGKLNKDSIKFINRVGDWGFTFLVRQFYIGANVTDVLSGYYAWRKDVVFNLRKHLNSKEFEIEMEMITKMVKLGYKIYSVPITYNKRNGETKLAAFKDGIKILYVYLANLSWKP